MKNRIIMAGLLGFLFTSHAVLADDFYCPNSVTCTGSDISSCSMPVSNAEGWHVSGVAGYPPLNIKPGTYYFDNAFVHSAQLLTECSYYFTNDKNLKLDVDHESFAYADVNESNLWKEHSATVNGKLETYYVCDSSDQPQACPFTSTKPVMTMTMKKLG